MNNKILRYIIRILFLILEVFLLIKILNSFAIWYRTHAFIDFKSFLKWLAFSILAVLLYTFIPKEHIEDQTLILKSPEINLKKILNVNKNILIQKSKQYTIYKYKKDKAKFIFLEAKRLNSEMVSFLKKEILSHKLYSLTKMLSPYDYPLYVVCILEKKPKERFMKKIKSKSLIIRKGNNPVSWGIVTIINLEEKNVLIKGIDYVSLKIPYLYNEKKSYLIKELKSIQILENDEEL